MPLASGCLYRYWGKARKEGATEIQCHLLPYHCLDVAAVAAYWWDHAPGLSKQFCRNEPEAQYRAWMLFFIALHDLGKWDIRFQAKSWLAWIALNPDDNAKRLNGGEWNHGTGGLYWLKKDYQSAATHHGGALLLASQDVHPKQRWLPWMAAVAGHHGYIVQQENIETSGLEALAMPVGLSHRAEADRRARSAWLHALEALFLTPAGLGLQDDPPDCSPLLAGFCSVSDWLGSWSTEDTFSYRSAPEPFSDYFFQRYNHDAPRVMARSGLLSQVKPWQGMAALLAQGHQPRQLQTLVADLPVATGLTIIEAPTGSGKTETALACAWRLLAEGCADSIIFALPTQATANAMLTRLEKLATQLFEHPNLTLAHGNSRFNRDFSAIKSRSRNVQAEEAWAQCCEWLSRSSKRAFLAQIGVCTIDQVLISVLPVKHRFIRGFGLARSVLLVDEVHAYDTYMNKLLEEVLRQQFLAGQSAILLSATLSPDLRQRLLATYGAQGNPPDAVAYPLITWQQQEQQRVFDLAKTPEHLPLTHRLDIERRYLADMQPDSQLLAETLAAARAGAQVCLICNLVDVAQQIYQQLQAVSDVEVMLFHARFTLTDRAGIEGRTLNYFGPQGTRTAGRILVATQVVEQSLDLDFDWLITQHCPADLLFQRAGRLHRHFRDNRPPGFTHPVLTVLLPPATGYGNSSYIYTNTRAMWRTQQRLEQLANAPLIFPAAYRQWIDHIYQQEVMNDEPAWVAEGMERFEGKECSRRTNARLMLSEAQHVRPCSDDDAHVRAVTRDGENSLPLVPYVATVEGRRLLNGQCLETLPEFDQAEALALNRVNVPGSWLRKFKLEADENGIVWVAGVMQGERWSAETDGGQLIYMKEVGMTGIPTGS